MSIHNKRLRTIVTVVLGIMMLGIWLYFIDVRSMFETLGRARLEFVAAGASCLLLSYFIRSQRWRLLFRPVGEMKGSEAFNLYMGGVAVNFILPIRAGEVAKSLLLRQTRGTAISKSMATIVVDRSLDLSTAFVVLLAIPFLPFTLGPALLAVLLSVVVLLIGLAGGTIAILALRRREANWATRLWMRIPELARRPLGGFINSFVDSLSASATTPRLIAGATALTFVAALVQAGANFFVYRGLGYPMPFYTALVGITIFELTFLFPTPPGQVGSLEVMMALIFSTTLGIPLTTVSAAAVVGHTITTLVVLGVGGVCLNALGVSLSNAMSIDFSHAKSKDAAPRLEGTEGGE